MYFNPRPPHRGRREVSFAFTVFIKFQSTSPARGTTSSYLAPISALFISIHVPRMGDDSQPVIFNTLLRKISIHVPRTGDDRAFAPAHGRKQHFNPRPPHGGRLVGSEDSQRSEFISIHVPRMGDDNRYIEKVTGRKDFNPRPRMGDDRTVVPTVSAFMISIHVPRMGDDLCPSKNGGRARDFNPRPPHGGRHHHI